MMPWCPHKVPWHISCSRCHEEEIAEDLSNPDELIDIYTRLHAAIQAAKDRGRPFNFELSRENRLSPVELGMSLWRDKSKRFYEFHDGHHDIGGEA